MESQGFELSSSVTKHECFPNAFPAMYKRNKICRNTMAKSALSQQALDVKLMSYSGYIRRVSSSVWCEKSHQDNFQIQRKPDISKDIEYQLWWA